MNWRVRLTWRTRRAVGAAAACAFTGCAYFNGVYNANEAQRSADKRLRAGREADAAPYFATAAEKAETVLARWPRTRWRTTAVYLAGRGLAHSDQCDLAEKRLEEFLADRAQPRERRRLAELALGRCRVQQSRYREGIGLLKPLTETSDRSLAGTASLWAARASIGLGDNAAADRYLKGADAGAAQWELAAASIARMEYPRAESLLILRARRGDIRDDAGAMLRDLWQAGRAAPVERILGTVAASPARGPAKARLHLLVGQMQLASGQQAASRRNFDEARRLSTDTTSARDAAAHVLQVDVMSAISPEAVGSTLAASRARAAGSSLFRRIQTQVLLFNALRTMQEPLGTGVFLAAEVARDSLGNLDVARTLLNTLVDSMPTSALAPKALHALSAMSPDSSSVLRERMSRLYPRSPYTLLLNGVDATGEAEFRTVEDHLRRAWRTSAALATDSIARLYPVAAAVPSPRP